MEDSAEPREADVAMETNEEGGDVESGDDSDGGDSRVMALMSGDEVAGRYKLKTSLN